MYFFRLQSQWLLDPLIERKLPIMTDIQDHVGECDNVRSTLTNHQKIMVFLSSLFKEILSDSNESTPSLKSEVVTRDCFVRLLLETCWVRHWCICVLGCSDTTEVTPVETESRLMTEIWFVVSWNSMTIFIIFEVFSFFKSCSCDIKVSENHNFSRR